MQHIDHSKYLVVPIAIDKKGKWHVLKMSAIKPYLSLNKSLIEQVDSEESIPTGWLDPRFESGNELFSPSLIKKSIDVAYVMIHGFPGEDGSLAGLFSYLDIPVVGCGAMALSIGMHKIMSKQIVSGAGIDVAKYQAVKKSNPYSVDAIVDTLELPLFVKPVNSGSSIGISKVHNKEGLRESIELAFNFSNEVLIESMVYGREIEVAVVEIEGRAVACPLGEIISGSDFYSYSAKYDKNSPATTRLPQDIDPGAYKNLQETAIKVFEALSFKGMGRIDFFLTKKNRVVFNEVNAIPGFTPISLFPMMAKAHGISGIELTTLLIENALAKTDSLSLLC